MTEYGIADIRGKSDREVIAAMLAITDSRFQDELLRQAKDAGKIERAFELPKVGARQHAGRDRARPAAGRRCRPAAGFPFGTDFTAVEQRLIPALEVLKSASPGQLAALLMRGLGARAGRTRIASIASAWRSPKSVTEWFYAALVRGALHTVS